jgi:hypothetical protein
MAAAFLAEGLNAQFEAQVEPAKICQLGDGSCMTVFFKKKLIFLGATSYAHEIVPFDPNGREK